ncbi:DNA starvation/stationary phase protection protein [bacterium]|nr:DNA starvation/stationary phase protection protein [bacterium]
MQKVQYKALGFTLEETKTITEKLNILLANYQIHYQKLRAFHWNVTGKDFFDVHEQFEIEYNYAKKVIDDIAERIRIFGARPYSTMSKYLEVAQIEEVDEDLSADKMVAEIISDFEILTGFIIEAAEESTELGDLGTTDLLNSILKRIEKRHWMLSAFNN